MISYYIDLQTHVEITKFTKQLPVYVQRSPCWKLVSGQWVAECVVVFVFGRRNELWGFPPTGGWLKVWYYLFLADETHYEVFHLLVGGWIWWCLLLADHVINCGGWSDLYTKGDKFDGGLGTITGMCQWGWPRHASRDSHLAPSPLSLPPLRLHHEQLTPRITSLRVPPSEYSLSSTMTWTSHFSAHFALIQARTRAYIYCFRCNVCPLKLLILIWYLNHNRTFSPHNVCTLIVQGD